MRVFIYLLKLVYKGFLDYIPTTRFGDRIYATILFLVRHERFPSDRMLFNDVLYRLKTTDQCLDPLRVFVSDKEYVKLFIKAVVGDACNVPTRGVIDDVRDVRGFDYPASCCIKPTHASGPVILRRDNAAIDFAQIESWFSIDYYRAGREANYKPLRPKVIVEDIVPGACGENEFKFYCYNGRVGLISVIRGRFGAIERCLFDRDWTELESMIIFPKAPHHITKPANLARMLDIATALGRHFDGIVRIDMYSDGKTVFVGEITNVSFNAIAVFVPRSGELDASRLLFS